MSDNSEQFFSFACGPLTLSFTCDHPQVTAALARRYAGFASAQTGQIHAEIRLQGDLRTDPLLDQGMYIGQDGLVRFHAPGYQGYVDESTGRAALTLSSRFGQEDVEYFLRVMLALAAFQAGGLLFHTAGILRGDQAFLFFGHSGSGKTTVCRLSVQDRILNDDLILLMPGQGGWMAYSTPFWNPTQVRPTGFLGGRVVGIFRLVQAKEVLATRLSAAAALAEVISNVPVIPQDPKRLPRLIQRGQEVLTQVPAFALHFLPDPSFWPVAEAAVSD